METIFILANALAKAGKTEITRLDIQYNYVLESYTGCVWFRELKTEYKICEDGTILKVDKIRED